MDVFSITVREYESELGVVVNEEERDSSTVLRAEPEAVRIRG